MKPALKGALKPLLLALILLAAYGVRTLYPVNHDVAWFYLVARGVLGGGQLYRDYVEPNAPPASLSLIPAVWLARVAGIAPGPALAIYGLALAFGSFLLCVPLVRRLGLPGWGNGLLEGALLVGFCFLPAYDFDQREHLAVILMTPYLLATAVRLSGERVPAALLVGAGLLAAGGVGLKPPLLLIPVAVECLALASRRRLAVLLVPETAALAAGLAGLAAFTVVCYPAWLGPVRAWTLAVYQGYGDTGRTMSWVALILALLAGILALGGAWWRTGPLGRLRAVLAAAVMGAAAAFIVQDKGWVYQAFPCRAFLVFILALAPLAPEVRRRPVYALVAIAFGGYLVFLWPSSLVAPRIPPAIEARLASTTGAFYFLSTDVRPGIPLALATGRPWASRYPCLIMLPGLVRMGATAETAGLAHDFAEAVTDDLRTRRPSIVFVPLGGDQALPDAFDVLGWFLADPGFAGEWRHYRDDGRTNDFEVYTRDEPPPLTGFSPAPDNGRNH